MTKERTLPEDWDYACSVIRLLTDTDPPWSFVDLDRARSALNNIRPWVHERASQSEPECYHPWVDPETHRCLGCGNTVNRTAEPGEKPFNFRDARGILAQTETRDTSTIIEARKDWSEPTIESFESRMKVDQNGIEAFAEFRGDAVKAWCGVAVDWFRSVGGKSYVTMDFTDSRDGEHYTFTVQRAGGDSPASKIQRLEAELAALNRGAEPR